ncbi:hypothetical protein ABCR94_31390 [Streptomyces sp. 21So2-11]|uniref:hypothetical protein n=1 Tax=Streptomyces sp. 21So2-11 TaxID=3144408 RepID=UPI00321AF716
MNATQQHMLDVYRAAQLGTAAPPAPGRHDWQAVREVRDYGRFRAGVEGRPVRARVGAGIGARVGAALRRVAGARVESPAAQSPTRPFPLRQLGDDPSP